MCLQRQEAQPWKMSETQLGGLSMTSSTSIHLRSSSTAPLRFFWGAIFFPSCQCYSTHISTLTYLLFAHPKTFIKTLERNAPFEGIVDWLRDELRAIRGYFCYNMERAHPN